MCSGDEFATVWRRVSATSGCDGWGSTECHRVHSEWRRAGYPRPIESFIRWRANVGSRDDWRPGYPLPFAHHYPSADEYV